MFGIDTQELLVIAVIALIVIGPKDLPRVMRTIGHWVGRARGIAGHFRTGFDAMVREAELEELEKKWRAENEAIMAQFPNMPGVDQVIGDTSVMDAETADLATRDVTPAPPVLPAPAADEAAPPARPRPELP